MNLTKTLARNYFTCARSVGMGDEEPVKSGIAAMKRRVSLIKLRHQADRLGLAFDSKTPWILQPKEHLVRKSCFGGKKEAGSNADRSNAGCMTSYGCLADLVPDNPSDWIPFDELLANPPHPGGMWTNTEHENYWLDSSADHSVVPTARAINMLGLVGDDAESSTDEKVIINELIHGAAKQPFSMHENDKFIETNEKQSEYDASNAWDVLYKTVSLLKEAGNEALRASLPFLAARRYDKAINYCSLAYLEFPVGTVDFLAEHQYMLTRNGGYECRWNELLKTLILTRLNLAMCYLREVCQDIFHNRVVFVICASLTNAFTITHLLILVGNQGCKGCDITSKPIIETSQTLCVRKGCGLDG